MWLLFPELPVDHLTVNFLDPSVTLLTGAGNLPFRDARSGIGVRKDEVRRVARGANCGNCQAFFEKPCAVNRIDVIFENSFLRDVVRQRDCRALTMTPAAQERHVHHRNSCRWIRVHQDLVRSMTDRTGGRELVSPRSGLAVETLPLKTGNTLMTAGTLNGPRLSRALDLVPGMTIAARGQLPSMNDSTMDSLRVVHLVT